MAPANAVHRLVLPISDWPDIDRGLWHAGLAAGDPLDGPVYGGGLRPTTVRNAARSHGRFLAMLAVAGALDPSKPPAARVMPAHVRAYLAALRASGNTNNSIITRFFDLQAALRIMQPEVDFSWLTSPGGTSLRKLLPVTRRRTEAIDSAVLKAWGHALMDAAPRRRKAAMRCTQYRNGLLIAILASLAPRLRSIAALRLGKHVLRHGDGYRIVFTAEDLKNRRRLVDFPLPPDLTPHVERYLAVERAQLLGGRQTDWFWVGFGGARLRDRGIEGLIRRASKAHFGEAFGTHRFRHALATTSAKACPGSPGLAATILVISPAVEDENYNKAKEEDAVAVYLRHVQEERRRNRPPD